MKHYGAMSMTYGFLSGRSMVEGGISTTGEKEETP